MRNRPEGLNLYVGARAGRLMAVAACAAVVAALAAGTMSVGASYGPSVATDKALYPAGDVVEITAAAFAPNEPVLVSVTHADGSAEPGMGHDAWATTTDATGTLLATWSIDLQDVAGSDFVVVISGSLSGAVQSPAFHRRAVVETDQPGYPAGVPFAIAGRGFQPGETVTLQVTHAGSGAETDMGHEEWTTTAGSFGTIAAVWSIDAGDVSGDAFIVAATGDASGAAAPAFVKRTGFVQTDKTDYQPGDTVLITGGGFGPNEDLILQVVHANGDVDGNGHAPFVTMSDPDGRISTTWYVDPDDSLGSKFVLAARGNTSGRTASSVFWDAGTISLTTLGSAYTQDFDTLENTVSSTLTAMPTGWDFSEGGSNANTSYRSGTGSDTTGDTHSYGAFGNTERAFGTLRSGTLVPIIGAQFANNTGGTITSLAISYTGEMWRLGQNTTGRATDRLDFQLSTNATTLGGSTWTDVDSLDFNSPVVAGTVGALNGNVSPNRTAFTGFTISGLSIANGSPFWIRWMDADLIPGSDDGLAVDDFSITPDGTTAAPSLSINDVSLNEGNSGTTAFDLTVSLSAPAGAGGVTFDIATADGTATAPGDYTATSLTGQTIPAGSSNYTFSVLANGDGVNEGDELFFVNVTDVTGASVVDGQGQGTIVNDDAADAAPDVTSRFPLNGATSFPVGSNLTVTFSEPVTVTSSWFTLACSTSGNVATTSSGGPTTFTLDPGVTLVNGESCTLTVLANQVSDQDGNDPPDTMVTNVVVGFTAYDVCQDYTPIFAIQGSGLNAAITGTVSTRGVVVGDFETTAGASGFYIQDPTGDGDPATSDGIFVYTGTSNLVSVGQIVRVTGVARERFNLTTLNGANNNTTAVAAASIVNCGTGSVTPTDVSLPFPSADYPERYEGMLVRFPQPLVISEYFNYDRFGEIVLAQPLPGETRPFTGTAIDAPGAAANARTAANALSRITLDDAQSAQNPPVLRHPNGNPFSLTNSFRGGDTVQNALGVLGFDFSLYRIIPTGPADYTALNPRPTAPEPVGGTVRVAAMNTLNFFVTADYLTGDPLDNRCGPLNNVECRGWDIDQPAEFTRQRDKLLQALSGLNGDIIGLIELENSTGVEPLASIVAGLPGYAYIDTGIIGTDAIKVGMIYRPSVVTPVGTFKLLTSAVDPRFIDTKSRPTMAQTFEVNASGARFTVALNHFKSKGSDCNDVGDPDLGDGQSNCSQTRRAAAEALVDWLATDPTGSNDPDFLIVGDLNSYAMEESIGEIKAGSDDTAGTSDDFINLVAGYTGAYAYSYTFDGQAGYLDHALANASLASQVTGVADWHINSDEPDVLDYDTTFKPAAQDALYEPNAYRTSDHDAVVIGLTPNAPPTVDGGGPYSVDEGGSVTLKATGTDPNGDTLTYAWDLDNNGRFETNGQSVTFSAAGLDGPTSATVAVQAGNPLGLTAVATVTVNVLNAKPSVNTPTVAPEPSTEGQSVTASATFSDAGVADTHTCTVDYGDGSGVQAATACTSPWTAPSHTYPTYGTYTLTISVTDDDGGVGTSTGSHVVIFNWTGFFPPVDNLPTINVASAGSAIPVKFSLGGDKGLAIFAAGYPRTVLVPCNGTSAVEDAIEQTVTAGGSALSYDALAGQYVYTWKSDRTWANTCRELQVRLVDGTTQSARFHFKK